VSLLDRLRVDRLYVRLFDLDATGTPIAALPLPLTRDAADGLTAGGREIVPVVYVAPDTLRGRGEGAAGELGVRTVREALGRCHAAGIEPREIQMDYDWTVGTRVAYFSFLAGARRELEADRARAVGEGRRSGRALLSATIRPHQVKDRKSAGVPPVDRGMLMAYNLSPPADPEVRNSILDFSVLEPYLPTLPDYPLGLDVALPCYAWVVHFENRRVLGLIPYAEAASSLVDGRAFRRDGEGLYTATMRAYVGGRSVEPGDVLRVERTDPALVLAAARALARRLPRGAGTVAFFSLDAAGIPAYSGGSDETFSSVYSALGAGPASRP
jgi:hypothetical protein